MTTSHLVALAEVLTLVVALEVSVIGWGCVAETLLGIESRGSLRLLRLSWLGWALTLLLLQLVHFVRPLGATTVVPLYGIGIAAALIRFRAGPREILPAASRRNRAVAFVLLGVVSIAIALAPLSPLRAALLSPLYLAGVFAGTVAAWNALRGRGRPTERLLWRPAVVVGVLAVLAIWIASRAMAPPTEFDFGLYYQPTIRWINEYPVVPGLGNLHARLAFNQSSLLFVASLNLHPFYGQGRVVAAVFVMLLLVASLLSIALGLGRRSGAPLAESGFERLAALFLLPLAAYVVMFRPGISSVPTDLVTTILQMWIFLVLCRAIDAWNEGRDARAELRALAFLAATAVTLKLSSLAFAGVVSAIAYWGAFRVDRGLRGIAASAWLPAVALTAWSCRGLVLSGMPLFPSSIGRAPVDWVVSTFAARNAMNSVLGWARKPGVGWDEVLGRRDWIPGWVESVRWNVVDLTGPLAALVLLSVGLGLLALRRVHLWGRRECLLVVGPACGVVYWFWTAPDPRFLGAQLWLLLVAVAIVVARGGGGLSPRLANAVVPAILVLLTVPIDVHLRRYPWLTAVRSSGGAQNLSLRGYTQVARVPLRRLRSVHGAVYFMPRDGDQCWDAPLPCSDQRSDALELRRPGRLAAGFREKRDR